jgi:tRNA nucleotidyltransferase/poly(A) polymerase
MELLKLLVAKGVTPVLTAMQEAGILVSILGGVPLITDVTRMATIETTLGFAPDPIRRLAALNVFIAEDGERLLQRLRLSNAERERLESMGNDWRSVSPQENEVPARALLYRIGSQHFTDRVLLAWTRGAAKPDDGAWRSLTTLPLRWTVPVFPLKAADLMQLGVEKGPALGMAMRAAEAAWITADFPLDDADLKRIAYTAAKAAV